MTAATYRRYAGTAAQRYQDFFVPAIATPVAEELVRVAALRPGERVLDAACGTGAVTRAAAEVVGPTGSVTGIDIAPDMLAVARTVPAVGAPIGWEEADVSALPSPDAAYDVTLCQLALPFIPDPAAALRELRRVLRPGGRIIVNTPGRIPAAFAAMRDAIADNIDPKLGAFVATVFSMPDPSRLADMLIEAGFREVTSKEYFATLALPRSPAELLWSYINVTPLGPLLAQAPEDARTAMETQFINAVASAPDERNRNAQPIALASGRRP
jgi:ubiquinone/menaquinone biosynthesis C-methylase UbiE